MNNTNPVVHFEMGYFDRERMKEFYEETFGWKMKQMGAEMGNYVVAQTTQTDDKGMVQTPGTINGGFYKKEDSPLSHAPSIVISVPNIRMAMKAVQENGGMVLGAMNVSGGKTMEPMMIPGVGFWISAQDTEKNRFSLLQPVM